MLKEIVHIDFRQLIKLDLGDNLLVSIEEMYVMSVPMLKRLYLFGNSISIVTAILRMSAPII